MRIRKLKKIKKIYIYDLILTIRISVKCYNMSEVPVIFSLIFRRDLKCTVSSSISSILDKCIELNMVIR